MLYIITFHHILQKNTMSQGPVSWGGGNLWVYSINDNNFKFLSSGEDAALVDRDGVRATGSSMSTL